MYGFRLADVWNSLNWNKAKHYHLPMSNRQVQIVPFVDEEPQPGIVESQFRDANLGNHLKAAIDNHFKTGHRE